jgi:hypothetical protein
MVAIRIGAAGAEYRLPLHLESEVVITTKKAPIKPIDPLEAILSRIQDNSAPAGWALIHQLHSFPSSEEMAFRSRQRFQNRVEGRRLTRGVRFQKMDARLIVEYDYESDSARVSRMRVSFFDVLAVGYRETALAADDELGGAREVRCVSQSHWLDDVVSSWRRTAVQGNGAYSLRWRKSFKHYTVFSLEGRVDVVAASCHTG